MKVFARASVSAEDRDSHDGLLWYRNPARRRLLRLGNITCCILHTVSLFVGGRTWVFFTPLVTEEMGALVFEKNEIGFEIHVCETGKKAEILKRRLCLVIGHCRAWSNEKLC